jgi:hypothetical protein
VRVRKAIPFLVVVIVAAGAVAAIALAHRSHRTAHPAPTQQMRRPAQAFLTSVMKLLIANRYGAAWSSLNPAHQAVAPRAKYIACERQSPIRLHLVSLKVLAAGHERVRLVPHGRRVDSVAVTFGAMVSKKGSGKFPLVLHLHAMPAGSHWTWILPPERYALYRSGGCASTAAQASP